MLHTNFQGHRPFGSTEDILRFLPYMGMRPYLSRDFDHLYTLLFTSRNGREDNLKEWMGMGFGDSLRAA